MEKITIEDKLILPVMLFWDVDPKELNAEEHARFIVGRVLDFGEVEDFWTIERFYGLERIKQEAQEHPFESERSRNFWELILKLPPHTLSCTRKHLPPIPSAFLNRSAKDR